MFDHITLFTKRYLQITMVFILFTTLQLFFNFPHDSWIIITSALLYSGFNPGTVLKRAYLRFSGTVIGIAAVTIVWHIIHFDYRLEIIFLVVICWATVFFTGLPYNRFMIIVTLLSDITLEFNNPKHFELQNYIIDRFIATAIVFGVCILVEYLWFGRQNMTHLNYLSLRQKIKTQMENLYAISQKTHLSRSTVFKHVQQVSNTLSSLEMIINDGKYENRNRKFTIAEIEFAQSALLIFRKILNVYYLRTQNNYDILKLEQLKLEVSETISKL